MWTDVAVVSTIYAIGILLMGHFEEGVPKWRRVTKLLAILALVTLVSRTLGPAWVYGLLGVMGLGVLYVHGVWLPSKGINGWTAEPKERYYALRGWRLR